MQQPQGPGGDLAAALAKAERILSSAGGARAGHVSVACKPTGEVVQLLSPPERGVPHELWAALEASEAALPEPHVTDSPEVGAPGGRCGEEAWQGEDGEEGRVGGKRLAGPLEESVPLTQRSRPSLDPRSPGGASSAGAAAGGAWAQDGGRGAGTLEHASQVSAASGEDGGTGEGGEDMQVDSSQGGTQFLKEANPVLVAPSIPPEDPYLLKDESLSAVNTN